MGQLVAQIILFIIRSVGIFYGQLPRKLQIFCGNSFGNFLYTLGYRRKVVEQNMALVGNKDVRKSYQYFGNLILEVLMVFGSMKKFVLKYVDVTGMEHITEAKKKGRGVIFLSSHLGNWEVMAATGGVIAGIDLMLVTKRLKPAWLHQAIEEGRASYGVTAAYEPKTVRQILAHLKKNGVVGFVLDQYAGPPVGVRIPLFGVPVGTSLALAALVKRTQAVLLPVENFRKPDGRWAVVVHPPVEWQEFPEREDSHFELAANTAAYVQFLQKSILAHPAQWLWVHRRFKGDLSPLRENEWSESRARR